MAQSAAARDAAFAALYERASAAGQAAGEAARPEPMYVGTAASLFDDSFDPSKPVYYVSEGVCGFAWVIVQPGNGSFARWARRTGKATKAYGGGVTVARARGFGQSYERKSAYAQAFAAVLREAGVPAYAEGRLD